MNKKNAKTNEQMPIWKWILLNGILLIVIVVVMLICLRQWLNKYTEHGIETEVPQVTGLTQQEAEILLQGSHLKIEVIDSTYSRKVPLGTIVEQSPAAESHAKHGRTVYVIMNAKQQKQVALPDLVDVSYRQAQSTLRQVGLQVSDIVYEPSAYRDLVLDVRSTTDSASIIPGTMLTENTTVVLVVGQGLGAEQVKVPDLRGLNLYDARSLLLSLHLTMGTYTYDEQPTEDNEQRYVVYKQEPENGIKLQEGQTVNVYLSTNLEKAATTSDNDNEEEFF